MRCFSDGGKNEKKKLEVAYENPYTLEILGKIPFLTQEEAMEKVAIAAEAGEANRRRSLEERQALVRTVIAYLEENKEQIALEVTEMNGKPIT